MANSSFIRSPDLSPADLVNHFDILRFTVTRVAEYLAETQSTSWPVATVAAQKVLAIDEREWETARREVNRVRRSHDREMVRFTRRCAALAATYQSPNAVGTSQ